MNKQNSTDINVPISGYIALLFAIIFFAGVLPMLAKTSGLTWLNALDFSKLSGNFGIIGESGTFRGTGGTGAKDGFIFAFSLIPSVMLALGVVELVDHYKGLNAAQKLLTPFLKTLVGLPGVVGLAMISSLQSTDAGASMTKELRDNGDMTENEKTIFAMFQFTAAAPITNFLSSGFAIVLIVEEMIPTIIIISFIVMFFFKIFAANIMRLYVKKFGKEI